MPYLYPHLQAWNVLFPFGKEQVHLWLTSLPFAPCCHAAGSLGELKGAVAHANLKAAGAWAEEKPRPIGMSEDKATSVSKGAP